MQRSLFFKLVIALLAVGQVISSIFISFNQQDRDTTPTITPAGYTFSIWGLIMAFSLGYAAYQFLAPKMRQPLIAVIAPYVMGVYAGFTLWLVAAHFQLLWLTVVIFAAMYVCLWQIVDAVQRTEPGLNAREHLLFGGAFYIYLGWTSVAVLVNVAAALQSAGWPLTGMFGTLWQALILAGSTASVIACLLRTRGNAYYFAAIVWAFIGAVIGAYQYHSPTLSVVALVGLVIATVVWFKIRTRSEIK